MKYQLPQNMEYLHKENSMPRNDALRNDCVPCLDLHHCDVGAHDLCSQDHLPDVSHLYGVSGCRRLYAESVHHRHHDDVVHDHHPYASSLHGHPYVFCHRHHDAFVLHDVASLLAHCHEFSLRDSLGHLPLIINSNN